MVAFSSPPTLWLVCSATAFVLSPREAAKGTIANPARANIKSGGKLSDADWASVPIPGKTGPLDKTLGVCDNVSAFNGNGHQAQIKAFLDFAYQDTYQVAFDKEYDLLPATNSGVQALSSDPVFAPFLKALPNSVQYPNDPVWSTVKSQIQTSIGTIVSKDPKSVLSALQQTATKGS